MVTFLTPLNIDIINYKGSIGHTFVVYIRTENLNQICFSPFGQQEISLFFE